MNLNLNRLYIGTIIILQIAGLYGGLINIVRVITYCNILVTIYYLSNYKIMNRSIFFVVSIIWSVVLLSTAKEPLNSVKDLLFFVSNFLVYLEIERVSGKIYRPNNILSASWMIFLAISFSMSIIEIITDYHFPNTLISDLSTRGGELKLIKYTSLTFGNYNNYNVVICYGMGIIVFNNLINGVNKNALIGIYLMFSLVIVSINGSRGATFIILLLMIIHLYKYRVFLILIILLVIIVFTYVNNDSEFVDFIKIVGRFKELGITDSGRNQLYGVMLKISKENFYVGLPFGEIKNEILKLNTYDNIESPHNLFLEILTQFGIIPFVLFLSLLLKIHSKLWTRNKIIGLTSIIIITIVGIINSSYILNINFWIYLACLNVIFNYSDNDQNNI